MRVSRVGGSPGPPRPAMARLSVKDHLDGILSDFEALKKSFEAEDGDEAPGSPLVFPLSSGTGENHRPLQPSPPPCSGTATGPSPAPSPVLRTRLSASLATGRANGTAGTGIARTASFQTRQASAAGPGSDGESLRSSSSSLESPAPTRPLLPPGSPPATSPGLKKVPSHGSVFPVELDHPLCGATASHGSLPALDLHIAEEPGTPGPDPSPWGTQSPAPQPRTHQPSSSSSSLAPYNGTEAAPGLPTVPEGPGGWDAAPRMLSRPQLRVTLSASPIPSRRHPPLCWGQGEAAPPPPPPLVRAEGLPPLPAPQAATFRLVSQPQTVQVSSQPAFLGGLVLVPTLGTPAAPRGARGNSSSTVMVGPRGPCEVAAAPSKAADGSGAAGTPEHGSSLEPEECSMEPPAVPEEEVPVTVAPGPVGCQLFGYVGIEAVLDQMKIKTMKTGFEFNIMVVGQSGLGKSTMVNTLFKSKVSRKSSQPGQEERIPKTVQLQSITHVIEEKGVKMKLTVTDTPGFGDQINNENCWDPIIKYINEQYERYLREEILITRKRKIPDTRVHGCVYFVPPTGHWLRPLDLEFMRRLSKIVNVVPVIAKADTLTLEERAEFKQRIQEDLKTHAISVYPQEDFDQDPEDRALNDRIREKIPFAVVGADQEHQVNGKRVLGRKTKWGIIEVENPAHCEFPLLRDLLIRSHLQDLKDITHNVHYESYRVRRLNESNRPVLSPLNGLPGKGEGGSHL
ncbi:LOW QUALITY PROTEIN: septin-12 [Myiozetetes cayanensis]|uniref:LOW QUALITY PROTEIN: septin-12 n=2 Tax=Passeriformes TaxID=9126 RepID=UPI00215DFC3B|nr:LOW QUALITY PROTEIN: septin-12 [Myiozetetes cayanensis]